MHDRQQWTAVRVRRITSCEDDDDRMTLTFDLSTDQNGMAMGREHMHQIYTSVTLCL